MSGCDAEVFGLYPVEFTQERVRAMQTRAARLYKITPPWESEESRAFWENWEGEVRSTMKGLCLIELLIMRGLDAAQLGKISQDHPLQDNSQVLYQEHWLDETGSQVLAGWSDPPPQQRPVRLAFYLHFVKPRKPLYGPWGSLELPAQAPMPARLESLMPYDPPD